MLRGTCDFGRSGQCNHRKFAQLEIYKLVELCLVFGVSIQTRKAKTFAYKPAHSLSSTFILGSPRICAARRDSAVKISSTNRAAWPPRRRVPRLHKTA